MVRRGIHQAAREAAAAAAASSASSSSSSSSGKPSTTSSSSPAQTYPVCALVGGMVRLQLVHGVPLTTILASLDATWPSEPPLRAAACTAAGLLPASNAAAAQHELVQGALEARARTLLLPLQQQQQHQEGEAGAAGPASPPSVVRLPGEEALAATTEGEGAMAEGLRMLVQTLQGEGAADEALRAQLRERLLSLVAACVEGLEAWQYSLPGAAQLLQVHLSLATGQVRADEEEGEEEQQDAHPLQCATTAKPTARCCGDLRARRHGPAGCPPPTPPPPQRRRRRDLLGRRSSSRPRPPPQRPRAVVVARTATRPSPRLPLPPLPPTRPLQAPHPPRHALPPTRQQLHRPAARAA